MGRVGTQLFAPFDPVTLPLPCCRWHHDEDGDDDDDDDGNNEDEDDEDENDDDDNGTDSHPLVMVMIMTMKIILIPSHYCQWPWQLHWQWQLQWHWHQQWCSSASVLLAFVALTIFLFFRILYLAMTLAMTTAMTLTSSMLFLSLRPAGLCGPHHLPPLPTPTLPKERVGRSEADQLYDLCYSYLDFCVDHLYFPYQIQRNIV